MYKAYYPNIKIICRTSYKAIYYWQEELRFFESSNGAKASAILYSLVETAKANQVNTYKYLELLLTELPKHQDDKNLKFIDDLLPWSKTVQKDCPSIYKKS